MLVFIKIKLSICINNEKIYKNIIYYIHISYIYYIIKENKKYSFIFICKCDVSMQTEIHRTEI